VVVEEVPLRVQMPVEYGGHETVIGETRGSGGKSKVQGGKQPTVGFASPQTLGST
jgi:hypothetical protein